MNLITDRTLSDVNRWRTLRDKGWSHMTPTERQEWLGEIITTPAASKGMYTHKDLNRVESAVKEILERYASAGYKAPALTTKTDWTYTDEILNTDVERYLGNVAAVRELLPVFPDTPIAPTVEVQFSHERANDVEKILNDVINVVVNLTESWCYAGEIISGEV